MPGSKTVRNGQIRLIRVLAHDLRNPISGILAASQWLIEDAAPLLDSQQITLLRSIESSSDLMLRLIEDMLEVAQAGSGKSRLRLRPTDVSRVVDQTAAIHQPLAETKNIRLKVRRDDVVPPVNLDRLKITQALNALLTNVVRCSPPGGQIEVDVAARPKRVVIAVRHVGSGDAVRNPDSTAGSPKLGARQASTLTLSAVRLIVERHGGSIRMEKGATHPAFILTLPRSGGSAKSEEAGHRSTAKTIRSSTSG
jgi:K+-sensing histidine kinase KdpD